MNLTNNGRVKCILGDYNLFNKILKMNYYLNKFKQNRSRTGFGTHIFISLFTILCQFYFLNTCTHTFAHYYLQ